MITGGSRPCPERGYFPALRLLVFQGNDRVKNTVAEQTGTLEAKTAPPADGWLRGLVEVPKEVDVSHWRKPDMEGVFTKMIVVSAG